MAQGGSKWHPLHTALIFGELDKARQVFENSDNDHKLLSDHNSKGWAALHFAAHSGCVHSVEWLLSLPACDPGIRTTRGETALHLAAARGDESVCNALLKGGCPAEAMARGGRSALHLSAENGHLPVTRLLVVGAGLSPATPDGGGSSAAALAAAGNHKAVLRLLQKSCPGVSLKAHNGGRRRSSDLPGPVADSTGLSGGDRSRRKHERRIGNNREPQQRVSINPERGGGGGGGRGGGRGAAAKGAEEAGHRLFKAARNGDTIAMGEVLARGEVGVEWVGRNNGWTAVMEAAEHGSLEGVCYLVDMGADLERTNKKGFTPLQLAVRSGHLGVAEEVLRRGARSDVITKAGLCLRCLANSTDHGYLADWLFAMGVADGEDGGCACKRGTNGDNNNINKNNTKADVISTGKPVSQSSVGRADDGGASKGVGSPAERMASSATGAVSEGAGAAMSPAVALAEWLASLGLEAYEHRLVSQGFDTLEAMGTATEADLEAMGFKKGHLRLLLTRAPSAAPASSSGGRGGDGGGVSAASEPPSRAAVGCSPDVVKGKSIGGRDGISKTANGGLAPTVRAVNGHADAGRQEEADENDDEEDEEEGRYADALALHPMRALSNNQEGEDGSRGLGSGGVHGERSEGFKELKREEIEIDEVIGEGSYGVVRRGRWRGMDVAVKELKVSIACIAAAASSNGSAYSTTEMGLGAAALGEAGDNRQRVSSIDGEEEMRHEARMLAKVCNHVCVVQFVGVLLRPVPSVVTRFMENGSVEKLLVSTDWPATKDLVARMAIEAAKGVIHLHREGVVHRDLASRNLLLDVGFHVRISDFGFSRVKRECASRGYTRSDMGPIKWTSPEAMRKRCYSEASDAFSFGVVLYEMFARRAPWENHENLDVAFRVCSGERMMVPPQVDEPMSELMFRCWRGNPRARPDFASILTSLTQFSSDLAQEGGDELVEPPPSEDANAAAGDDGKSPQQPTAAAARANASPADRAERAAKAVAAAKAAAAAQAAAVPSAQQEQAQSQTSSTSSERARGAATNGSERRERASGSRGGVPEAENGPGPPPRQRGGRGWAQSRQEPWREGRGFPGGRGREWNGGGRGSWGGGRWTARGFFFPPSPFQNDNSSTGSNNGGGRWFGGRVGFGTSSPWDNFAGRGRGGPGYNGTPLTWRSAHGGHGGGGRGFGYGFNREDFVLKGSARTTPAEGRTSTKDGRPMPGRGGGQRGGEEGRNRTDGRADRPP